MAAPSGVTSCWFSELEEAIWARSLKGDGAFLTRSACPIPVQLQVLIALTSRMSVPPIAVKLNRLLCKFCPVRRTAHSWRDIRVKTEEPLLCALLMEDACQRKRLILWLLLSLRATVCMLFDNEQCPSR